MSLFSIGMMGHGAGADEHDLNNIIDLGCFNKEGTAITNLIGHISFIFNGSDRWSWSRKK